LAGGNGIKVGNMVPACCGRNPGGSIEDTRRVFPEAPFFTSSCRA
jgi:hypothetical protein